MSAEVVQLHDSNFRDTVAELRRLADEIERGDYGPVGSAALVIMGDTLEVFRMGEDAEACSIGMLLHAGFMRMSQAIEEHGVADRAVHVSGLEVDRGLEAVPEGFDVRHVRVDVRPERVGVLEEHDQRFGIVGREDCARVRKDRVLLVGGR